MSEKILIALSDQKLIDALIPQLKEAGYVTQSVQNSKEAISQIKDFKPDLAIVDINLPVIKDFELFTQEYIHKDITKTPMIIISNSGDPIQMNKIPSTPSIKDYIIKFHIQPEEIIQKIEKALGKNNYELNDNKNKPASPKNKKILWVEDDKLLGNILSKKLETSGYTLYKAVNATEALQLIETETFNMIILDIMLPEMNGFQLLELIKKNKKSMNVPVLILSNLSRTVDIEKAKNLGANRFLVKAAVSLDEIVKETELEMSKG